MGNTTAAGGNKRKREPVDAPPPSYVARAGQAMTLVPPDLRLRLVVPPDTLSRSGSVFGAVPMDEEGFEVRTLWTPANHHAILDTEPTLHMLRAIVSHAAILIATVELRSSASASLPAVLKIRTPRKCAHAEAKTLRTIYLDPVAGPLLPEIYAFVRILLPTGHSLDGILMQRLDLAANALLYPGPSTRITDRVRHLGSLYVTSFIAPASSSEGSRGMPLDPPPTDQSDPVDALRTAVAVACLRALQAFHDAGWVHADTHLGNFLLDSKRWTIVLIDFERTFRSEMPIQTMLDVQELFGHLSSALTAAPYFNEWDLCGALPIATRLHPLLDGSFCSASSTADPHVALMCSLLPVCDCFVEESLAARINGCPLCRSDVNRRIVRHYQEQRAEFPLAMYAVGFARLHGIVCKTRDLVATQLALVPPALTNLIPLVVIPGTDDEAAREQRRLLLVRFKNEEEQAAVREFLISILFQGALCPRAAQKTRGLLGALEQLRFDHLDELRDMLPTNVSSVDRDPPEGDHPPEVLLQ